MSTTNNFRGSHGIISQIQSAAHQTINNHDHHTNPLVHPISNNNRPNSSNMPYTGSHQQIIETNLNHSKSNAANMQLFKNNHIGKPPKAINQSMQHVTKGALISQDLGHPNVTTQLDLSVDSISNRPATALLKHTFNIDSSTTLKTAVADQLKPQKMMMQVLHQEMGSGNSHKQTPAQGGSGIEGAIKGRKIDNPHLVVVKELKEQEDFDETMRANHLKNGALPRRSRIQEDLLNMSLLNNSSFIGLQKPIQNPERQRNSKSQEHNPRRHKSKERPTVANAALKDNKARQDHPQKTVPSVRPIKSGTKSSRENVQTASMGLNELLIVDQQPGFQNQQQTQGQADFKNRTHHEILKQTANGMDLKQAKSKKGQKEHEIPPKNEHKEQSRSRSRDKKPIQQQQLPIKILAQNLISAILPKSLALKDKSIHYKNQNEPRKISSSTHAHTDASAEKKTSQFIQQTDLGGRCVTSQGLANQSQINLLSLNSNGGRTFSQPNLAKTTSKSSRYTLHTEPAVTEGNRQQSSPDRSMASNSNHLLLQRVQNLGIDKLVKQNLIKMRSRMEEEMMQRQVSEERLRKKKEMLDQSNNMVRKVNKDKIYKQANHHHQHLPNALGNQQSQDYVLSTSNPSTIDYPGANPKMAHRKIELKHLKQQLNINKLSQSQKIDFALIKESSKNNKHPQIINGNKINNHRKSYGLEFIDIKKEIQEELKTIEQRHNQFHYKDSVDNEVSLPSQDSNEPVISSMKFDYNHVPKRLKIKQASRQLDHVVQDSEMLDINHNLTQSSFLDTSIAGCQGHQNNKTERGGSDEQQPSIILDSDHQNHQIIVPRLDLDSATGQPNQKILVVKKSKIRKFMKMKKREKQKEQLIQQNNEILKTIKMQENITRLNEFCKKNIQKNFQKKRNATIQQQLYENLKGNPANHTKISGRKIDFEEGDESHQKNDESSRLSTEFYEEYYNAIKALKNPGQSRQQIAPPVGGTSIKQQKSSPTNKSLFIKSNGTHNQTLVMSPKIDKAVDESKPLIHIPKPSKSSLSNTTGNALLLKQKFKKPKTSKSRHPPALNVIQNLLPISSTQQNIISNFIAKKKQRSKQHSSQDRSESAPLYKKKTTSQTRLNHSHLNDSMKQSSQNSKGIKMNSSSQKQSQGLLEIELELMHIYLTKQATKIQRAFRKYLQNRGFCDQEASTVLRQPITSSQSQFLINTTEEQEETVRRDKINNEEVDHKTLDYLITDGELAECPDTTIQQPKPQQEDDIEYDEEEDEYSEGDNNPQLIIINQDQLQDDEKKIVYLSNINSCSLPQTPKQDDDEKVKQPSIQGTFDYIAHKKSFILEQIHNRRGSQVNNNNYISQSSSVDEEEDQSVIQNPDQPTAGVSYDLNTQKQQEDEDSKKPMVIEELKNDDGQYAQDYGMRMLTGSQSLLREIKMASTPRDQRNISSAFKDMISIQRSVTQSANKRNITSNNSEQSFQTIQVQPNINNDLQHQTNTTSSHQSIFDRNSFQNFTAQKLQDMIRNNEFLNLISMRERALDYRQDKERRHIKKLYKARQMSPRTYTEKKEQLEKWVRLEQDDIQRTKVQYQQEWDKAVQMIEDTQKNALHLKEQIFTQDLNDHHHIAKQGGLLSSRNSSASMLYNTQHSCQKKSILEQEEYQPIISHRHLVQSIKKPDELQNNTIGDSNYQEQTKHTLFKSHLNTLDEQTGIMQPLAADGTTLMDFLEESWKRTQGSVKKKTITAPANPNSIFIQDQHSVDYDGYDNQSSLPVSVEKTFSEEDTLNPTGPQDEEEESRTLLRSRPEQDLTDLIKKNKPDNTNDYEKIEDSGRGILMLDADESFRILDSERLQQNQSSQIKIIKRITSNNDDIKIQENLIDDSSHRQLSSAHHNVSSQLNQLENEVPSQEDSLLNEHELNQYFNDEHQKLSGPKKFSIEDFKQLDKRNLLLAIIGPDGLNPTESARTQFDLYEDDEDELISKNGEGGYVQSARDTELKQEDGIMAEEKQITLESNQSLSIPDHEGQPQIQFNNCYPILQKDQSQEPEIFQIPQTSSFLFQNAKPGENIKIADILRKNTQHQQQQYLQSLQVQLPSTVSPLENEKEQIVFEIAEEILRMLIDEQVNVPLKRPGILAFDSKNLEASPEYSLIVPQRIENNGGDPTIPMFTFDALELDEINLEQKQLQQPQAIVQTTQQNLQNQDVFLVDNSFNEKEQRRELIDLRQRMLIESDLSRIEGYINEIINTLQQHELNYLEGMSGCNPHLMLAEPNFHRQFLQVLTVPIKRSQLDVLNHLQTSEIGSYEHFETAMDISSHPILPVDLYLDIERQREEQHLKILSSYTQVEQQQEVNIENSVIQESVHIHNKGIFDALNESLMKFRPYGIQGEPMPWSNKVRRLQTKVDTSQVDTERLFFMVKQDVMRWASNCVGCLPSQIFMARRTHQDPVMPPQFDEAIFQETRERRLAQMLASEVVETEHQWLNYEFEESQIKIDLSDMILEQLVDEVVTYLQKNLFKENADIEEEGASQTDDMNEWPEQQ